MRTIKDRDRVTWEMQPIPTRRSVFFISFQTEPGVSRQAPLMVQDGSPWPIIRVFKLSNLKRHDCRPYLLRGPS